MHFDIPDLRLFIHVAEANSLTGGARRASLSTAAASMRIKSLEGQLGSRLFYRDSQGVELTPAGHDLLVHARAIMRQVDYIKDEFSQYAEGESGHLRIFANTTAVSDFMPDVLARFLATRPGVTVDLQERLTHDIVRGVIDGSSRLTSSTSGRSRLSSRSFWVPMTFARRVPSMGKYYRGYSDNSNIR